MKKEIPDHFTISSADQLKALAGPVRFSLFKHLLEKPWTAMQLAQLMKVNPTKLYYHLNAMEKHGVITVVSTSKKRNFTEKTYRAVAKDFKLDDRRVRASKGYLNAATEALHGLFDAIERDVDAVRLRGRDPFSPTYGFFGHNEFRLSPKDGKTLQDKLWALASEYEAKGSKKGEIFCLSMVYYPKKGRPLVGVKRSSSKQGGREK